MKNIKIITFVLIFVLVFSSFARDVRKKENIYIVLDRNSKNVFYSERLYVKDNIQLTDRYYTLKSYGNCPDNIITVTFLYYDPKYDYSDFDMLKDVEFCSIRKPITFLDSIKFVDENYIMSAGLNLDLMLRNNRIFLLDQGTIENNSIMMYEVLATYDGFER